MNESRESKQAFHSFQAKTMLFVVINGEKDPLKLMKKLVQVLRVCLVTVFFPYFMFSKTIFYF